MGSLATSFVLSSDMFANYFAGKLADNGGRKKTLLIGVLISIIAMILMVASRLILANWLFWAGIILYGLSTAFTILNRTAIMDMYPKRRGQSLGYLNTGGFIGTSLAPLIIIIITGITKNTSPGFDYYNMTLFLCLPFLIFSGLLLSGIRIDTKDIAQILLKRDNDLLNIKQNNDKQQLSSNDKRNLILAFLISSLSVGGVSIALSLSPILMHILNAELWWISFSIALISFGTSGLSIFLGRTSDKIGKKKTILIGIILMGIGLCAMPFAQNIIIITFSNFLVGLGTGAMAIASTSLICDLISPENRGKIFGLNSAIINVFTLTLPPICGIFFSILGPFSVTLVGLIITGIAFLSIFFIKKKVILTNPDFQRAAS